MSIGIELVGGPRDGDTAIITLAPGVTELQTTFRYSSSDGKYIYLYNRTNRRSQAGRLLYEYSGHAPYADFKESVSFAPPL